MILVGPTPDGRLDASATLDDGKWHLVTGTYNGSVEIIYVDGKQVASQSLSGSIDIHNSPVQIGNFAAIRPFNGTLDDLRIYNRALSATEVQQLYNMGR